MPDDGGPIVMDIDELVALVARGEVSEETRHHPRTGRWLVWRGRLVVLRRRA